MSTAIEWTDETWNPVVGCTKVSQGCKHCYAKTLHDKRHKAALAGKAIHPQYLKPFETVQLMEERLRAPLHWTKPRRCFVNSVSDVFHEDVPDEFIAEIWATMALARAHTFQVLTKRAARMATLLADPAFRELVDIFAGNLAMEVTDPHNRRTDDLRATCPDIEGDYWPLPNVWVGVSVEDQDAADERISWLQQTPAAIRFLSCEPLLGPVDLTAVSFGAEWINGIEQPARVSCLEASAPVVDEGHVELARIDWVIVGGESGAEARLCDVAWIESIAAQCWEFGVPLFVKQLGSQPIMNYYQWLQFCEDEGFDRSVPVYVTTQRQIGGSHTYYRWYLGENGSRHDGQPPVNAWVEFPCKKKGGNPSEWPARLRVRQYPGEQVPA